MGALAQRDPLRIVLPAAVGAALVLGTVIARSPAVGVGLAVALAVVPLALTSIPLAVGGAAVLAFVEPSGILGKAPYLATLLTIAAWAGTTGRRRALTAAGGQIGAVLIAGVALLAWLALSAAWATDPRAATATWRQWLVSMILMLVVATAPSGPGRVRLIAGFFVAGAVLSVAVGLTGHGLSTTSSALQTAASARVSGGAGDPNYLAAGLVPALVLAAALAQTARDPLRRLALVLAVPVLAAGLAATQSRGGLIALGVAALAGIALARGYRARAIGVALTGLVAAGAFFAASPSALQRVTHFNGGGNGRTELWRIALRMFQDHPVLGTGLSNYQVRARDYVAEPGSLQFVRLIVDQPHVAHNTYLQALAETGVPGLVLLLAVLGALLGAGLAAARRFERAGQAREGLLARAMVVASLGMLTASVFISNGSDKRLWILLGIGPALLLLAPAPPGAPAPAAEGPSGHSPRGTHRPRTRA